jgi:Ca-activated chloride channel family protein
MFRFEHIEYLWMLVAIVPFTLLFAFYRHWVTESLAKLGKPEMMRELSPERSSGKIWLKFFLLQFAFVFIVLGFANPQIGTRQEKVKRQGIDVVVAMDVSNSMMSEDIKPSRLARAKNFVSHFMDELRNDRFGMIVFAGKAYLQMPLTVDYSAGRKFCERRY